jgi:hypothetical protein
VTELAVLQVTPQGFKLLERAQEVVEHIIASTEAELRMIEGGYSGDGDLTSLLSKILELKEQSLYLCRFIIDI